MVVQTRSYERDRRIITRNPDGSQSTGFTDQIRF
jgi:hypothetical protein